MTRIVTKREIGWAGIAMLLSIALLAFTVQPASAATQSEYASGWTSTTAAQWVPLPPASTNPLGPSDHTCIRSTSQPGGATAFFTFPGFAIPDTDVIDGVEVTVDYVTAGVQIIQLTSLGSLTGSDKVLPINSVGSSCSDASELTLGGPVDLWGATLTPADFNAGTIGVHIRLKIVPVPGGAASIPIDIDSIQLKVHHSSGLNADTDGDGVFDDVDNCVDDVNADQANNDGDAEGDVCDVDDDNDGVDDSVDAFPRDPTRAVSCDAGLFGAFVCAPAGAGHFVAQAGQLDQQPCSPGTFQAGSGATSCDPAPAGTFVATPAATAPVDCSPGFYQPNTGATSCLVAEVGHYVDTTGAIAATPCPLGQTTAGPGATSAAQCFPIDTDGDGVADINDVCPATVLPDEPTHGLKKNRYAASVDGFASTDGPIIATLADTGGCSAAQIIANAGLGNGHTRFGITQSALQDWINALNS